MGTPGIKFILPEKDALLDIIKRHKGRVKHIAAELDIHRGTFLSAIQERPEEYEFLKKLRNGYDDLVLDMAEDNMVNMLEEGDATATFFTLNTRGQKRDWNPRQSQYHINAEESAKITAFFAQIGLTRKAAQVSDSSTSNIAISDESKS